MNFLKNHMKYPWLAVLFGSLIGAVASFLQVIERIEWAARPSTPLACDLTSSVSCSTVFGAWQSSFFGFSNAILCLTFFAVMFGFGLAGLFSATMPGRRTRLVMHFFALFFLGFGAWYLQQSAFVIGAFCIYCVACYTGVILMNWGWLRLNAEDMPLGTRQKNSLKSFIKKGNDTFVWALYALIFVAMFAFKFWA